MKLSPRKLIQGLTADTSALAIPEGRRVGPPGHKKALRYLTQRLDELDLCPWKGDRFALTYERPHPNTGRLQEFTNLIAVRPGRDRSLPAILLGAHYDSVLDAPCADDNATSVALNLAIAEEFAEGELERDLIIALFDAEEPPHFCGPAMGSRRFVEDHCEDIRFAGVIVSDLIGHDLKLADLGVALPGVDLLMPQAGKKGRYYHDEKDDLDWINFKKLAAITEFVAACIRKIDERPGGDTPELPDTVDFEVRMIRQAVGPVLPLLLKRYGVAMPTTRHEMDALIGMLV